MAKIDGKLMILESGNKKIALSDGIFFRILFHGDRPTSALQILERDSQVA
ncbi:MAG: hypothetical protein ACREUD_09850 [Gammaproteobacteria bacterium]